MDPHSSSSFHQWKRKRDFLERAGKNYGYGTSSAGHLDDWRSHEFPTLIPPIRSNFLHDREEEEEEEGKEKEEREVYLDYAGASLSSQSQLSAIFAFLGQTLLANPHSFGPAAARTQRAIEHAKTLILNHFQACPGPHYYNNNQNENNGAASQTDSNLHPGYDVLFTSGATDSLRIVAQNFAWTPNASVLLYARNSHTSVIGMRGVVLNQKCRFSCQSLQRICSASEDDFHSWATFKQKQHEKEHSLSHDEDDVLPVLNHLLVLPMECNFAGLRLDLSSVLQTVRNYNKKQLQQQQQKSKQQQTCHQWFVLVDMAKAAATGPVHLRRLNPDFAVASFYKLFGYPTGLGALLVKRTSIKVLTNKILEDHTDQQNQQKFSSSPSLHRYFGGGSVDAILSGTHFVVPRGGNSLPSLASLANGTVHYEGIASLMYGFRELERVGGMHEISLHTRCLAQELSNRLKALHHSNGRSVIVLYGPWANQRDNNDDGSKETSHNHDRNGTVDWNDTLCKTPTQDKLPNHGPTLAFNVLRYDGSTVGYNEVSKLAALNRPPIQFRTGCFCNPGACQDAMDLSDDEIIDNYVSNGHVCGDDVDVIRGRPTGAIRVSFGKESAWEDLDALVVFLERVFVHCDKEGDNKPPNDKEQQQNDYCHDIQRTYDDDDVLISEMYIYPIKSCAPMKVQQWKIHRQTGKFLYDRKFALVDATTGSAMRLQSYPKMGFIRPRIDLSSNQLIVSIMVEDTCATKEDLILDLTMLQEENDEDEGSRNIRVCGDARCGEVCGGYRASQWFSSYLGVQCWLAYSRKEQQQLPSSQQEEHNDIDSPRNDNNNNNDTHFLPISSSNNATMKRTLAFENDAPILLISQRSVDILNTELKKISRRLANTRHFRPNLVVSFCNNRSNTHDHSLEKNTRCNDDDHHPEDDWSNISVPHRNIHWTVTGPCARCQMIDVDPTSQIKGKALRGLAQYRRRKNGQLMFGVFLGPQKLADDGDADYAILEEGDKVICS